MESKNIEFVVAKYLEDVSWTADVHPFKVTIYDKSNGQLPNVGREAHTYLYHIVNNYHNLADVVVFMQGNPFAHTEIARSELKEKIQTYPFDKTEAFFNKRRYFDYTRLCNATYKVLFGYDPGDLHFTDGAIVIAQKSDILCRPLTFYQKLYEHLCIPRHTNDHGVINAWTMECMWQFVFNPSLTIADSFYDYVPDSV
jgi:hypothetical protein